jgi:hypothetical protein
MMSTSQIAMRSTTRFARPVLLATALLAPAAWAAPFTVNAGGTVTDAATGLTWDQCYLGQGTDGCAGLPPTALAWADALVAAQDMNIQRYKGHADWRLPNVKELLSLRDLSRSMSPAVDLQAFPGTLGAPFWSSTTVAPTAGNAWAVGFAFGETSQLAKTDALYVRLVRGGQRLTAFDALDTTAPITTAGPSVLPGATGASVTVNEDATGYWLVQPAGQPAPTPAALMLDGAPINLAADVSGTMVFGALAPGGVYVLYFIASDTSGNTQANVTVSVFTASSAVSGLAPVPASSPWGLGLLAVALGGLGWRSARRARTGD